MAMRHAFSQLLRSRASTATSGALRQGVVVASASRNFAAAPSVDAKDDIVKQAFVKQQAQFRNYVGELAQVKITLDPEDPAAVKDYADKMKAIRTKLKMKSPVEKLAELMTLAKEDSTDVRGYFDLLGRLRVEVGIEDDLGADKLFVEALNKVEKKIGKVLRLDDKRNLALLGKEVDEIHKKLGLDESQLPKLEQELEMALSKAELEELTKEATEKMELYKRRDELESIVVSPKDLDFRPYL